MGGRDVYFERLAHIIVELGKSEICRAGCRLETQGRGSVVARV